MIEHQRHPPALLERAPTSEAALDRDLQLVRRARGGDPGAVEEFLRRMRVVPELIAMRNARMGRPFGPHELEELAQDVLLSVWRKLDAFEARCPLEAWVYRFLHLEMLHRLRTRGRQPALLGDLDAAPLDRSAPALPPLESEALYRVLDRVGPPDADILRLKHLEGLSFTEVAERLRMNPNTAKTQYYRGLRKARGLLRAAGEGRSR